MTASISPWRRLALLLLLFGVTVRAAHAPLPAITTAAALQEQLAAHLGQPRFHGALWGLKVASLDSGRTLFEYEPDRRLSPASNSKLYVGALALARLGGDYRIITPLLATAPVTAAGELPGDLVVAGRGDPSWAAREAKRDFWNSFMPFITALRQAGVRHIRGDVVADATWLRGPPHGAGWTVDDLNDDYGAEVSAVTLADNYVALRIRPAGVAGAPCAVEFLEPFSGLTIDNRTVTVAPDVPPHVRVQRLPGTNVVLLFGSLPAGGKEFLTEVTVPRPAAWFASALKDALVRAGIAVDGAARSIVWPEPPARASVPLGEITSPPLRELVAAFMLPSQNLETDLVFTHLGESRRTAATPDGASSEELAVGALDAFLREAGVGPGQVIFEEGSGLSRNNLTTAAATVQLLTFMAAHREAAAFLAALPVAGRSGSLASRMKETPAEGNVRAKTGSLRWASALSGYVRGAAGERLVFSLMLNRHVAPPERKAREELDELAVLLACYAGPK